MQNKRSTTDINFNKVIQDSPFLKVFQELDGWLWANTIFIVVAKVIAGKAFACWIEEVSQNWVTDKTSILN